MGRKKRRNDARGYATVSIAKAPTPAATATAKTTAPTQRLPDRPPPLSPDSPSPDGGGAQPLPGVWLGSTFISSPAAEVAGPEQPQRESPEQLRVAVGRQRQRLLGLLQDNKPSAKKVSHLLQKLAQYRAEYPDESASDWLGPVYTDRIIGDAQSRPGGTLCVGCGDGSYEMGMMLAGANQLTVSFYESEVRLRQRYTNFAVNTLVLRFLGAQLLFEVDATALAATLQQAHSVALALEGDAAQESHRPPSQYSRVEFNFPQTGNGFPGSEQWYADHAALLRGYFRSIAGGNLLQSPQSTGNDVSSTCGEVGLTLMDRAPYSELPIDMWAAESGWVKKRVEHFDGGQYGLYKHRMTRYDRVVKADAASSRHVYTLSPTSNGDGPAVATLALTDAVENVAELNVAAPPEAVSGDVSLAGSELLASTTADDSVDSEISAGCSIWVTRVQLPEQLVRGGHTDNDGGSSSSSGGAEEVAGGRRNNPRGKRVWPLCPSQAHAIALRRTLEDASATQAASTVPQVGDVGELRQLTLHERFGIATFDCAATARRVCDRLEETEVQWTARGRSSAGGGEGVAVLDRAGRCMLDYRSQFLARAEADALLQQLHVSTPWKGVRTAAQAGKQRQPRQVCYYADSADMTYTYGGRCWAPLPWTVPLRELKEKVERACGNGVRFNSLLLNLYEDGRDHVPWHSDNEAVYGDLSDCSIASVSLGAVRPFQLRPIISEPEPEQESELDKAITHARCDGQGRIRYMLQSGSLLIMGGATQLLYEHRLPRRVREGRKTGLRINATFRSYCYVDSPHDQGAAGRQDSAGNDESCVTTECADGFDSKSADDSHDDNDDDDDDDDDDDIDERNEEVSEHSQIDNDGLAAGATATAAQMQLHRFAARPITRRLFVGHGFKKLPPSGVAAVAAAFAPLLPSGAEGTNSGGPPTVVLETRHRGYAFATLPGSCVTEDVLRIVAKLDGQPLDVIADTGGSVSAPLNVCPATDPVCKHFAATGLCRLGDTCRFRHVAQ